MRLLVAEDERDIAHALKTILTKHEYLVDVVYDGYDALHHATNAGYDGIVMDIMMPHLDGIEVLKQLREKGINTPVLLLTARGSVSDKVGGLDAGADDYLSKPFAVSELLARVRALLRRKNDFRSQVLSCKSITLDTGTYELSCEERVIPLVGREFQVMELLMETATNSPRQVVTTSRLMEHVWGWESEVDVSVAWVTISNLRKKIQSINAPVEIQAVRGVGYCLKRIQ